MRIGSLCSGIGGLDLAVEKFFGATTAWHCEVDKYASQVLARHWEDVPNHGDIKATNWRSVEPVDILAAGYPCQPFSNAGRRRGAADARHLWPSVMAAIGVLRPRYVVLENVDGHRSLGFAEVLGDLAASGYDATWLVVQASDVGGCHRRRRLFVLAVPSAADTDDDRGYRRQELHGVPSGPQAHNVLGRHAHRRGVDSVQGRESFAEWEPAVQRWESQFGPAPRAWDGTHLTADFVEWMMGYPQGWTEGHLRTKRLKMLGNAVMPQQAYHALDLIFNA